MNVSSAARAPSRRSVLGGALNGAANLGAGALNVAFMLLAARQLSLVEFGVFQVWAARFMLADIFGIYITYLSNFHRLDAGRVRQIGWGAGCIGVLGLGVIFAAPTWLHAHPVAAFGVAIVESLAFYAAAGQSQARLWFLPLNLTLVAWPIGKLLIGASGLGGARSSSFFLALPASYAIANLFYPVALAIRDRLHADAEDEAALAKGRSGDFVSAAILAFLAVAVPQIDLLNVTRLVAGESLGAFAQAAMVARFIHVASAALLATLFPWRLRAARGELPTSAATRMQAIERTTLIGYVAFAFASAWVAPPLARLVGIAIVAPASWIIGAGLTTTALVWLSRRIQQDTAAGATRAALTRAGLLAAWFGSTQLHRDLTPLTYMSAAAAWYVALTFLPLRAQK